MSDIEGATNTYEAQSKNMINICIKYGFDGLIISGGYVDTDDTRHTMDHRQRQGYGLSSSQGS